MAILAISATQITEVYALDPVINYKTGSNGERLNYTLQEAKELLGTGKIGAMSPNCDLQLLANHYTGLMNNQKLDEGIYQGLDFKPEALSDFVEYLEEEDAPDWVYPLGINSKGQFEEVYSKRNGELVKGRKKINGEKYFVIRQDVLDPSLAGRNLPSIKLALSSCFNPVVFTTKNFTSSENGSSGVFESSGNTYRYSDSEHKIASGNNGATADASAEVTVTIEDQGGDNSSDGGTTVNNYFINEEPQTQQSYVYQNAPDYNRYSGGSGYYGNSCGPSYGGNGYYGGAGYSIFEARIGFGYSSGYGGGYGNNCWSPNYPTSNNNYNYNYYTDNSYVDNSYYNHQSSSVVNNTTTTTTTTTNTGGNTTGGGPIDPPNGDHNSGGGYYNGGNSGYYSQQNPPRTNATPSGSGNTTGGFDPWNPDNGGGRKKNPNIGKTSTVVQNQTRSSEFIVNQNSPRKNSQLTPSRANITDGRSASLGKSDIRTNNEARKSSVPKNEMVRMNTNPTQGRNTSEARTSTPTQTTNPQRREQNFPNVTSGRGSSGREIEVRRERKSAQQTNYSTPAQNTAPERRAIAPARNVSPRQSGQQPQRISGNSRPVSNISAAPRGGGRGGSRR